MKRRDFSLALMAGSGTLAAGVLSACKPQSPAAPAASATPAAPATTPVASAATASQAAATSPGSVPSANAAPAPAAPGNFVAGQDYAVLKTVVPTDVPKGKAEVLEFFGYWCPHCYHFESEFEAWVKQAPKEIVVRRVPMAFRPDAAPLQRMYYALQALGKVDEMHPKVFDAIHKDKQQLFTDEAVLDWAARQPQLAGDQFVQAYKSFSMESQLRRANQLMADYGVEGVPSLGVAGKYYVDAEHAKGLTRALQIATALALQDAKS